LNEKFEGPSLERIRKAAEELKGVGGESKKENLQAITDLPTIQKEEKIAPEIRTMPRSVRQNLDSSIRSELKFAEIKTELSDLTQERLKLEKILQEINNLKGGICQRIGLLKMLEKGKKEIERAPNFLEETKNKLDNLREHIE